MKINIIAKNFKTGDRLNEKIEKKFEKLGKYFSDDIAATVKLSTEAGRDKVEATIKAKSNIFRAEESGNGGDDIMESVDRVVDKLSSQMSRFKSKLQKKYKDNRDFRVEEIPEPDREEDIRIVKTKQFELSPMGVEEAILQMEMLEHNFYVFLNMESDTVCVVYKRNNGSYGLLETK